MTDYELFNHIKRMARPTVVCLCGSTRFRQQFEHTMMRETLDDKIVLTVGMFGHDDYPPGAAQEVAVSGTKEMLDDLHKRKIDLADEILVINVGGYIGESTKSEIDYAIRTGKKVRYLES